MTTTEETTIPGTVVLTLTINVGDAAALIDAGRRSVTRDLHLDWPAGGRIPDVLGDEVGPSGITPDALEAIQSPDQAVVDLVVEALVRCYRPHGPEGGYLDDLAGALGEFDIIDRAWIPAVPGELSECAECGEEIQLVGATWLHTDRYDGTRTFDAATYCRDDDGSSFAADVATPTPATPPRKVPT